MNFTFAYWKRSTVVQTPTSLAVSLAPNLRRDRVSFTATLKNTLRFREAISALHAVVISALRYKPRDKTASQAYLAEQKKREDVIRRAAAGEARQEILGAPRPPVPPGLEDRFRRLRKVY